MTRYAMAVDVRRCQGCQTCAVSCKVNNNLPKGVWRNVIHTDGEAYPDTSRGEYPAALHKQWIPVSCQHCATPPCATVCPVDATSIRDDGIVVVDNEVCIGCGSCVSACPYGARTVNNDELEYYTEHALGDYNAPVHLNNTVEKCDFCVHRLDEGEAPACMQHCPGNARLWGDIDDPNSDISVFLSQVESEQLLPEEGTEPSCRYANLIS